MRILEDWINLGNWKDWGRTGQVGLQQGQWQRIRKETPIWELEKRLARLEWTLWVRKWWETKLRIPSRKRMFHHFLIHRKDRWCLEHNRGSIGAKSTFIPCFNVIHSRSKHSVGASHVPDPEPNAGDTLTNKKDMVAVPWSFPSGRRGCMARWRSSGGGIRKLGLWAGAAASLHCYSEKLTHWPCLHLFPPP